MLFGERKYLTKAYTQTQPHTHSHSHAYIHETMCQQQRLITAITSRCSMYLADTETKQRAKTRKKSLMVCGSFPRLLCTLCGLWREGEREPDCNNFYATTARHWTSSGEAAFAAVLYHSVPFSLMSAGCLPACLRLHQLPSHYSVDCTFCHFLSVY